MYIVWLFVGALALFSLAFLLGKIEKRISRDSDHAEEPPEHFTYKDDDDFDAIDEYQPEWQVEQFPNSVSKRPDGFVALKGFENFNLTGVSAPNMKTHEFFQDLDPSSAFASLKREPDNPYDPNAIRVYGHRCQRTPALQIGYVPAEVAAKLNEEHSQDMPLDIEIKKVGTNRASGAHFVNARLIGPNAKRRREIAKATS